MYGQKNEEGLKVIAKYADNSVMVRWAPLDYFSWEHGNENGYLLKRTAYENGFLKEQITIGTFRLGNEKSWEELAVKDSFAIPAIGVLYPDQIQNSFNKSDMAKYNINRYGFAMLMADMSVNVARNMGLSYIDKDVDSNYTYIYDVSFNKELKGTKGSAFVEVNPDISYYMPYLNDLKGNFGDSIVNLEWMRNDYYSGFFIERSEDGGITYKTVNDKPFVPMTSNYTDEENPKFYYKIKLDENFKEYVFRVRGKDAFGDLGPPSNTVTGMGKPKPIPTIPIIGQVSENVEGQFDVEWVVNENLKDKMQAFNIYRSVFNRDNYKILNKEPLSADTRFFRDKNPESVNFYFIELIDENDHSIKSVSALGQLEDHNPPAAPLWVGGTADTTGRIDLNWQSNTEEDFKGYHIYVGNNRNSVFSTYTSGGSVRDTFFVDSIEVMTLADSIYYKLKAIDFRGNFSPFSDILAVARPDIIPPVAPVFNRKRAFSDKIELLWTNSSSEDAIYTALERKKGNDEWEEITRSTQYGKSITFEDTLVSYKYEYFYRLFAEDEVGLTSKSKIIKVKPIDSGIREAISNLTANYEVDTKTVKIEWDYPIDNNFDNVVIYRSYDGGQFTTYKKIKKEELPREGNGSTNRFTFIDNSVVNNVEYAYRLILNHKDGGHSPLTEEVSITIPNL